MFCLQTRWHGGYSVWQLKTAYFTPLIQPTATRGSASQRILALLVLFDEIIIHDFSEGSFRIPDLENEGVVQVIARAEAAQPVKPLGTRWETWTTLAEGRPTALSNWSIKNRNPLSAPIRQSRPQRAW